MAKIFIKRTGEKLVLADPYVFCRKKRFKKRVDSHRSEGVLRWMEKRRTFEGFPYCVSQLDVPHIQIRNFNRGRIAKLFCIRKERWEAVQLCLAAFQFLPSSNRNAQPQLPLLFSASLWELAKLG